MIDKPIVDKNGFSIWTKEHKKAWKAVKITKSKRVFSEFLKTMDHCPNLTCSFDENVKYPDETCKRCSIMFSYFCDKQRCDALDW